MTTTAFYILAPLLIISALAVVLWKSPIASALSLVVTLALLALAYFLLNAPFVGILQVLIYAGAIMVLFIFVIMLINLQGEELETPRLSTLKVVKGVILFALLGTIGWKLYPAAKAFSVPITVDANFGSLFQIAQQFFGENILGFELISFVILVAAVGAIVLARRHGGERAQHAAPLQKETHE